jgi:hypothetical protein
MAITLVSGSKQCRTCRPVVFNAVLDNPLQRTEADIGRHGTPVRRWLTSASSSQQRPILYQLPPCTRQSLIASIEVIDTETPFINSKP